MISAVDIEKAFSLLKSRMSRENFEKLATWDLEAQLTDCDVSKELKAILAELMRETEKISREIKASKDLSAWDDLSSFMLDCRSSMFADLDVFDEWFCVDSIQHLSDDRFGMSCKKVGTVYMIELCNGVKVGKTSNIRTRLTQHADSARNLGVSIGRVAFTSYHGNYSENELLAHIRLSDFRNGKSEFFEIGMDDAIEKIGSLDFIDPTPPNFFSDRSIVEVVMGSRFANVVETGEL